MYFVVHKLSIVFSSFIYERKLWQNETYRIDWNGGKNRTFFINSMTTEEQNKRSEFNRFRMDGEKKETSLYRWPGFGWQFAFDQVSTLRHHVPPRNPFGNTPCNIGCDPYAPVRGCMYKCTHIVHTINAVRFMNGTHEDTDN